MENKLEKMISFFKNKESKISVAKSVSDILELIKSDDGIRDQLNALRAEKDKAKKDKLKVELPMVTFSGIFVNGRKAENLQNYSGIICLDIDKIEALKEVKELIKVNQYTLAVFLSPSGNGLKVLIKVNGDEANHLRGFYSLQEYYKNFLNIEIDKACKDIPRGAFISHDPDIYINKDSIPWDEQHLKISKMDKIDAFLKKDDEFKNGNRNNFVFKFASICREQKIKFESCLTYCLKEFTQEDFSANEIETTIKSAYENEYEMEIAKEYAKENKASAWDVAEIFINERYCIRRNIVLNKVEYKIQNSDEDFIDLNEDSIYRDMQKKNVSFSMNKLKSLLASNFVPDFDPFLTYFESLEKLEDTSGEDHIDKLASFIKTDDDQWFMLQFKKMLVRSIACALESKIFNKQVFILVHPMQNSGKSTFCRYICPPALSEYFTENIGTDKDSLIALSNNFIINMDELATLSKTEINSLKSMISRDSVNVRLPYGRRNVQLTRRANFVGSTNKDEFLTDETGSVRWLCFELTDTIDFSYKQKVKINFVWKQAYKLYQEGYNYELTKEELSYNEIRNLKYQQTSNEYELIQKYFEPCLDEKKENFLITTDIIRKLNEFDSTQQFKLNRTNLGKALRMLGYKSMSCYLSEIGSSRKGYYIKTNSRIN